MDELPDRRSASLCVILVSSLLLNVWLISDRMLGRSAPANGEAEMSLVGLAIERPAELEIAELEIAEPEIAAEANDRPATGNADEMLVLKSMLERDEGFELFDPYGRVQPATQAAFGLTAQETENLNQMISASIDKLRESEKATVHTVDRRNSDGSTTTKTTIPAQSKILAEIESDLLAYLTSFMEDRDARSLERLALLSRPLNDAKYERVFTNTENLLISLNLTNLRGVLLTHRAYLTDVRDGERAFDRRDRSGRRSAVGVSLIEDQGADAWRYKDLLTIPLLDEAS